MGARLSNVARLVSHPEPRKVWVQVPHRNDISSDWIEADASDWLATRLAEAEAEAVEIERIGMDEIEKRLLAEAALADLRARVEALAVKWKHPGLLDDPDENAYDDLRALLAGER